MDIKDLKLSANIDTTELEAAIQRELEGGGPMDAMVERVRRAINEAFDLSKYNAYARRRLNSAEGHCYEPDEISKAEAAGVDISKYATLTKRDAYAQHSINVSSVHVGQDGTISAMYQPPAWAWTPPLKPTAAPVAPPKAVEPVIPADRYDEVAPLLGLEPPGTKLERALAFINAKRRGVQRALDPKEAGWTDDDVFAEAKRLGWQG